MVVTSMDTRGRQLSLPPLCKYDRVRITVVFQIWKQKEMPTRSKEAAKAASLDTFLCIFFKGDLPVPKES